VQFGASILIWGVFVRTVFVWHQTWAVNSVTHLWGYRNYQTDEDSRNNIFIGLLAHGEGWHNNHDADPRSARHGHKWWEFDATWLTIRLFEGLTGSIQFDPGQVAGSKGRPQHGLACAGTVPFSAPIRAPNLHTMSCLGSR
jgi:fatty-acid desaturase